MAVDYWNAPAADPDYRWAFGGKTEPVGTACDSCPVIEDWSELDGFILEYPDPNYPAAVDSIISARNQHPDRYILAGWHCFFHQYLEYLRGIENILIDLYDERDKVFILLDRVMEFYKVWIPRVAEAGADGVWGCDDLGTQRGLFISPGMFREIYLPYYIELGELLHAYNLDYWLHTCGCISDLLDDFIECGINVLNPIQAGVMNDREIMENYHGKIAFWIGMDMQILPFASPGEVRSSVLDRVNTFYRPEGGLLVGMGNALTVDVPTENLYALKEALCEAVCNVEA